MYCECEFKVVFEAGSEKATLKIGMYEAAKLPRSSLQGTRKICQINSWTVPNRNVYSGNEATTLTITRTLETSLLRLIAMADMVISITP